MDIGLHEFAKRSVDRPMTSQRGESVKHRADDADAEMPAPIASTCVADMTMAVVSNFQFSRLQKAFKP